MKPFKKWTNFFIVFFQSGWNIQHYCKQQTPVGLKQVPWGGPVNKDISFSSIPLYHTKALSTKTPHLLHTWTEYTHTHTHTSKQRPTAHLECLNSMDSFKTYSTVCFCDPLGYNSNNKHIYNHISLEERHFWQDCLKAVGCERQVIYLVVTQLWCSHRKWLISG